MGAPTAGPGTRLRMDPSSTDVCHDLGQRLSMLLQSVFRPSQVFVHFSSDTVVAWAHLALAKRTICNPSTYCLWPTMAATRGFLADTPLFFSGTHPRLEGVTHLLGFP